MAFKQLIYQIAKSTIHAMPQWLLRLRPFEIHELKQSGCTTELVHVELAESNRREEQQVSEVRWVRTSEELTRLTNLAASVNLQNWNGKTCRAIVAWQSNASGNQLPVGIVWINHEFFSEPDLGLRFKLKSNETWLHSAHVLSDFRGQGIYQELLRFLIDDLKAEGDNRVLFGVTQGNESSKSAHTKAGAAKLGSILSLRSLGISCCINRGGVQPNGLRIGRSIELTIA